MVVRKLREGLREFARKRRKIERGRRQAIQKKRAESKRKATRLKIEKELFKRGIPFQAETKGGIGADIVTTKFIMIDGKRIDLEKTRRKVRARGRPIQRFVQPTIKKKLTRTQAQQLVTQLPSVSKLREITRIKPLTKLQKIERKVSTKLGLTKRLLKSEQLKLKEKRFLEKKLTRLQAKKKKSLIDKAKILDTKVRLKASKSFLQRTSTEIQKDILTKPVSNAALLLAGAGIAKVGGKLGLKVTQVANKSPKLAKVLGVSGKVAFAGLTTAYAASVFIQGQQELKEKGTLSKTTADVIRELTLLSLGTKLVSTAKTSKLVQLQKEINKLPKAQQKTLKTQLNKVKKLSEKAFKRKDIGVVTRLETQQINTNLKKFLPGKGKLQQNIITVTQKKIFVVKKGQSPKVQKSIDFDVIGVEKVTKKGITVGKTLRSTVRGKFNPKTGKVEIDKVLNVEPISAREANQFLKRFNVKRGFIEQIKKVSVKGFKRKQVVGIKIKPKITIKGKKVKKEFDIQSFEDLKEVKPSERKIKKVLGVKLKELATKRIKTEFVGEKADIVQFTPIKKVKPKPKKLKLKKIRTKPDQLIVIDKQGRFISIIKSKTEPKLVTKLKKKPVVSVTKIKDSKETLVIPFRKTERVVSQPTKTITEIKGIVKPRKPITVSKLKPKLKQEIKPVIKTTITPLVDVIPIKKPKEKRKTIIKRKVVQKLKPKQKVLPKQVTKKTARRLKLLRTKKVKPVKPKIILFKKKTKKKVKIKRVKKPKKPQIIFFTPTISPPKNKLRKEEKEILTFTGLEFRG